MEEFNIRLTIVVIIFITIIVLKIISKVNQRKISGRQKVNREILPFWKPGKESIIFFTNDTCMECEKLQKPALKQLQTKDAQIYTINASENSTLAKYYRIMTVPTTIILDNQGVPQFLNQGFTNEKILAEQLGQI